MDFPVPSVTIDQLPDGAFLLDVREPMEWEAGHAPDAHHLPMAQIPERMTEIPTEKDVVVVCRVGARSARVVEFLLANGRQNVINLDGGMQAWAAAGLPLEADTGSPPEII